jgi:chaperonin GroES
MSPKLSCLKGEKMSIKPVRDRILVKPLDAETTTKSGIVIPDQATEKPIQGKVIAAGSGRITEEGVHIPLEIKEGDTVMYSKFAGQSVKIADEDYIVLKEDDVLAIVE